MVLRNILGYLRSYKKWTASQLKKEKDYGEDTSWKQGLNPIIHDSGEPQQSAGFVELHSASSEIVELAVKKPTILSPSSPPNIITLKRGSLGYPVRARPRPQFHYTLKRCDTLRKAYSPHASAEHPLNQLRISPSPMS